MERGRPRGWIASAENRAPVGKMQMFRAGPSVSNVGRVSTVSKRPPALRFDRVIGDPLSFREREPRAYDLPAGACEF